METETAAGIVAGMQIEYIPTLEPVPEGCRLCTSCWVMLPKALFGKNAGGTDGLRSHCKECTSFRNMTRTNIHEQMRRARQKRRGAGPLPRQGLLDEVWAEWGGCYSCGISSAVERMTIGHILPLSRGGTNLIYNLAPQCWPCNKSQAAQTLAEWCPDDAERIALMHDDVVNTLLHSDR